VFFGNEGRLYPIRPEGVKGFFLKNFALLSEHLYVFTKPTQPPVFRSVFFSNEGRLYLIRIEGSRGFFEKNRFYFQVA